MPEISRRPLCDWRTELVAGQQSSGVNANTLARLEEKLQEIREATRKCNEALSELKKERRELISLVNEANNVGENLVERVRREFNETVRRLVSAEIKSLGDATAEAIEAAQKKITFQFEQLAEIYFKSEGIDSGNLFDTMKATAELKRFAGSPIAAAHTDLPRGTELIADGVRYKLGTEARAGELLYKNRINGLLYPGPRIIE